MLEKFITFGIGGCGCTIAHRMSMQSSMKAICIDTDSISLENKESENCSTILVGEDRFDGMGTGGEYETANQTGKEIQPLLKEHLKDCSLAIVVAGIGGGTGSAITPALLQTAQSMAIPTMVFMVHPFSIESGDKARIAARAISKITDSADAYCSFKNDDLCGSIFSTTDLSLIEAFEESNDKIISGITMLWRMFTQAGYVKLDLATLLACTKKGRGQFHLCHGYAAGESRTPKAINQLINSNNGVNAYANSTTHALVGVFGGEDLRLAEISDTVANLTAILSPDTQIELGTAIDTAATGSLELCALLFENWVVQYTSVATPTPLNQQSHTLAAATATPSRTISPQTISTFNSPTKSVPISPSVYEKFRGTQPLIYKGENLDEPTYLRKRIPIS